MEPDIVSRTRTATWECFRQTVIALRKFPRSPIRIPTRTATKKLQYTRGLIALGKQMTHTLADNKWLDEFLGFLLHELLAVVLCWIVTLCIFLVVRMLLTSFHLAESLFAFRLESIFNLFFWVTAVPIGLWFNRRMRHYSACWTWVLPILAISLLLIRFRVSMAEFCETVLTCHGECILFVLLTVPMLNCVAYSVGAWLALRSRKGPRAASTLD
jgi:hypothetical protein